MARRDPQTPVPIDPASDTKHCPYCGALIFASAKQCANCKRAIEADVTQDFPLPSKPDERRLWGVGPWLLLALLAVLLVLFAALRL